MLYPSCPTLTPLSTYLPSLSCSLKGVNVVIHGRKGVDEEVNRLYLKEGRDSGLFPFAADVTKVEELKAMVEATVAAFGSVDILVNNAGRWVEI
jgi:NAD(P)-dependent dehydrogenase (short-subunit alcohol dehydrogenase family)